MIASLPMYWRAESADAWFRFWDAVRRAAAQDGHALPKLTPPDALHADLAAHWLAPDLALSQTCGLPFRTVLKDRVEYVATFDFGLKCRPGYYYSQVIAHPDVPPGATSLRLAYSTANSQSGWAAATESPDDGHPPWVASAATLVRTGSHAGSWTTVAEHRADIACIDAVSWRLLKRFDAADRTVRLRGRTNPTPGLPLITAKGTDPEPLRRALRHAMQSLTATDAADMGGLRGLAVLTAHEYNAVPLPPAPDQVAARQ
ncbi:MAG: hypothetical protein QNJ16_17480 [Rhodobacter sp.]|nr:hypothetical protein [Rhodobacter sp.]